MVILGKNYKNYITRNNLELTVNGAGKRKSPLLIFP
jgi:hypothetical protein